MNGTTNLPSLSQRWSVFRGTQSLRKNLAVYTYAFVCPLSTYCPFTTIRQRLTYLFTSPSGQWGECFPLSRNQNPSCSYLSGRGHHVAYREHGGERRPYEAKAI